VTIVLRTLKKILFWSYDRGTWQYDIMCVLILAFVFFAPNASFRSRDGAAGTKSSGQSVFIPNSELAMTASSSLDAEIARNLAEKYGYEVTVSRIEPMMDSTGNIRGYLIRISADQTTARD
jgi:hypothetical protein